MTMYLPSRRLHLEEKNRAGVNNDAIVEIKEKTLSMMTLKLIILIGDKKEWRQKVWEIKYH